MIFKRICLLFIAIVCCKLTKAQSIQPFKEGDKMVFMGNSITDGGHYHSYIWPYYMTHFPKMRISIINAGIGGDVSRQMLERIDSEVFAKKPTIMSLTFGMNDTGYQQLAPNKADSVYQVRIDTSLKYFNLIVDRLKQRPEIKKIMIASPPYDETSKIKMWVLKGKNNAILKIAAQQQQTAIANKWGFVDFNKPLVLVNQEQEQSDSSFSLQDADRIHPTNDGQMVMAEVFLKAQGLAGKKVADVIINTTTKKTEHVENCQVSNLKVGDGMIKFDYLANSLPYPLDTIPSGFGKPERSQAQALKLIPLVKEFDQELLTVKGLQTDKIYALKIDGGSIGKYAGADLTKGINLALITATPQYQQALSIMHLNEERWQIERRLREYYWMEYSILKPKGLLFNDSEATMDSVQKYAKKDFFVAVTVPTYQKARFKNVRDAWKKEMDLLTDQIYAINKPAIHHFEVVLAN